MTAARGLVRFISQYKFFFLSFFLLFFSLPVHDGLGRRVHSFHRSMRSQSLSMPLRPVCNIRSPAARRRKHEKEAGEPAAKRSYDGFRAAGGSPPSLFPPRGSLFSHRSHRGSCTHRAPTSTVSLRSSFYYHCCYYNFE